MEAPKTIKKRKLIDKSIPNVVLQNPEFAEDSQMYTSLLEMERKLDWTMTRKKVEIQDALMRNPTTTRTLRLFLSHTVSGQVWQNSGVASDKVNFETGEGIPAWELKVEGRMLEPPNQRSRDKAPQRKFSTVVKRLIVELGRDTTLYPEGNIVEWPRAPGAHNPALDGFTVRRKGDTATRIRIILYLNHSPPQYKVVPELANVIGIKEDSRVNVIQALWAYIKSAGLQDKVDRRIIRMDDRLKPLFGNEVMFAKLPEMVNRYLAAADPIVLHYTINPAMPPPERPTAWDVEVKIDDVALRGRMQVVINPSKESLTAMQRLDEEIALHAQSLHNAHLKRTFLHSFAKDPAHFVQTWLESQSRDLENILGSGPTEGMSLRQEELRRSEFFHLPWVQEAVAIHESLKLAERAAT
ncbi:SWI/SNF complex 60 kDa subunit [Fistulina hepatica ATCC 64428]|uniref:SWI/SNF complex 60 kDa subunit n=1 Tax=Fistulina hepatica ATCC 64428 TaxID=1128425 RepID=A0A0D7AFD0_9AGAR|nr:SWI/SNF complex 60 kDa subunit [Fistulina hepatica ATCC 64428]